MKQVFFRTPDDAAKGYSLLLHKGSIVYTGITGRYIVPEESVELLEREKVPFVVEPSAKAEK